MSSYQAQYADITRRLMEKPKKIGDSRIGKINSNFVETIRIDLQKEFPIMDIKWIKFSNVVHELLWMLRGDTNPKYLIENGCRIWSDDAYRYYKEKYSSHEKNSDISNIELTKKEFVEKILSEDSFQTPFIPHKYTYGDLDKIYGYNWRRFNGQTDQVQNVLNKLKENPDDRRMIIIGHNPTDLENGDVGLPSCHNYMQFYTKVGDDGRRKLSLHCHIRSNDWFLGQPYNTIQYALLVHIFAKLSDMDVDELVITATDAHLYHIHFEPAKIWLDRFDWIRLTTKGYGKMSNGGYRNIAQYIDSYCKAKIEISGEQKSIDDFKFEDFVLTNYKPQKYIKAQLLT